MADSDTDSVRCQTTATQSQIQAVQPIPDIYTIVCVGMPRVHECAETHLSAARLPEELHLKCLVTNTVEQEEGSSG